MIIVTQDKNKIVPLMSSPIVIINGGFFEGYRITTTQCALGTYSTEERARQELQEIVKAYRQWVDVYEMKEE